MDKKGDKVKTKSKILGPYDIIKLMFTDLKGFDNLSDVILERNSFMINRIFAIQYPEHAQLFNKIGMSGKNIVKAWRIFGLKTYGGGKVPSFIYTKGDKAKQQSNKKTDNLIYSKENINNYCEHYNINYKDFYDMLEFIPDVLKEKMDILNKQTSTSEINKQFEIQK